MNTKYKLLMVMMPFVLLSCKNKNSVQNQEIVQTQQEYDIMYTNIAIQGDIYEQMMFDSLMNNPDTRDLYQIIDQKYQLEKQLTLLQQPENNTHATQKQIRKISKQIAEYDKAIERGMTIQSDIENYFYNELNSTRDSLNLERAKLKQRLDSLQTNQK